MELLKIGQKNNNCQQCVNAITTEFPSGNSVFLTKLAKSVEKY